MSDHERPVEAALRAWNETVSVGWGDRHAAARDGLLEALRALDACEEEARAEPLSLELAHRRITEAFKRIVRLEESRLPQEPVACDKCGMSKPPAGFVHVCQPAPSVAEKDEGESALDAVLNPYEHPNSANKMEHEYKQELELWNSARSELTALHLRVSELEAARGFTDPASGTNYGALAESVRALDALSSAHPSPEPFSEENKALRAIAEIDESLKNHERRLSCVERVAHSPVPLSAAISGLDARLSALEQSRAPRTEGKDIEVDVAARVDSARRAGVVEGLERAKVLYVTVPHDIQHHRAFTLGSKALRDSIDSELQRLREETPTTAPNAAGTAGDDERLRASGAKSGGRPESTCATNAAGQPGSSATSPAKGEDFEAVEELPTHGTPTEENFFEQHARAAKDMPMNSILVVGSRAGRPYDPRGDPEATSTLQARPPPRRSPWPEVTPTPRERGRRHVRGADIRLRLSQRMRRDPTIRRMLNARIVERAVSAVSFSGRLL